MADTSAMRGIPARMRRFFSLILPLIAPALFLAALYFFRKEFESVSLVDLADALYEIPFRRVLGALLLTGVAHFLMTVCEWLAVIYAKGSLPYRTVGPISFVCTAVGHNFGNAILVGGALRARLYSAKQLSPLIISKIVVLYSLSYWVGYLVLAGFLFLLIPPAASNRINLGQVSVQVLGGSFLMLAIAYFAVSLAPYQSYARNWTLRYAQLRVPAPQIAVAQTLLTTLDQVCAAGTLYLLLGSTVGVGFPAFLGIFLLALVAGIASQVPGGLGVFETAMLLLLRDYLPASSILGALLVFRIVFYLLPLGISLVMILLFELRLRAEKRQALKSM